MSIVKNTPVALFWHFHQPIYSSPGDNIIPLPWVRLHCLKDYLDMLKHIQKFPGVQATFNFSPSLLLQIEDYRNGKCTDRQFLLFKKRAEELTAEDKIDILRDFFLANWKQMIEPYPRYFSLLLKRGKNIVDEELGSVLQDFTVEEFRDLQVWANLAWIDPVFRNEIDDLYRKGKNFTEADKDRIITLENKIIGSIFDEYKGALESNQIDITTSPLYHPILPLLINSNLAKVSEPNLDVPFIFVNPEDARYHVNEGIAVNERFFGRRPKGMWPSEGAVCDELLPILAAAGIEWIATDEEILARSIKKTFRRDEQGIPNQPELLYVPRNVNNIKVIFRDHLLSDLIGFEYNRLEPKDAVQDFLIRIKYIRNSLPGMDGFIIPVILDGENAWEYYKNDGTEFLERLYGGFLKEQIPTTTVTGFLHTHEVKETLPSLFPGSWISANFDIWIGQKEDHKGWQIIKRIRDRLVEKKIDDKEIWDRFYILEGSDWFWWFGKEYYSNVVDFFDELFRMNAIWLYKKIGDEPPSELFSPIKTIAKAFTHQPLDRITPAIDGQITHFYEWYNAGHADVRRMGGTMHRFAGLFSVVYCGFDNDNLYIRFDVENHKISSYEYCIRFTEPRQLEIVLGENKDVTYKIDQVVEVAVPFSVINLTSEAVVEFTISARQKGLEVDRTPPLRFLVRLKDVKLHNWIV